jgi:LacI family transcriptional regulator
MDPGSYSTIMERAEGYRQAHIVRDLPYSEELVVHLDWSADRIKRAYETLFSLKEPPTALLTSNDFIAYEFMNYLEENGKAAPEDLSIVGHGNIDRYSLRQFLTSVEQPFEGMGKAAAKLLLKRLVNRDDMSNSFQQIILPTPLIIRSSCKKLDRPNAAQLS